MNSLRANVIEREVKSVLLNIMRSGENDNIRIMSAKILIELIEKKEGRRKNSKSKRDNEERRSESDEISASIAEAKAVLAELAESKSGGVGAKGAVAARSEAATAYP